jgi:hypothetical protein
MDDFIRIFMYKLRLPFSPPLIYPTPLRSDIYNRINCLAAICQDLYCL